MTKEALQSTGKGTKLLVLKTNIIDEEHREDLLQVARTAKPRVAWEGSAWRGADSLAPRDQLRYALTASRLVAPHPNAGYDARLTPAQAVALVAQCRLQELDHFATAQNAVPPLAEASASPRWAWRFVGALGDRVNNGGVDALLPLIDDAPDPPARAACTVTAAAGLLEDGRADDALALLERTLARNDAAPVDRAWLTVQLARTCAEVGRIDEARSAAISVQRIQMAHPGDVTVTAMAGVAAVILFNISPWEQHEQKDVANVIAAMDTTIAWWRSQVTSPGLVGLIERRFKHWARDTSVRLGEDDVKHLIAASLAATHLGDHGAWRHLSGLVGQDTLLRLARDAEPGDARRGLDILRLAGDADSLCLAVRHLAADGPATAVTLAAAGVDLDACTRTTGRTNLVLLEHGGDLLDEDTANRCLNWLLRTLGDSAEFVTRTSPSYLVDMHLVDALAAVIPAASFSAHTAVVDHVLALGPQHELLARSWSRVVSALPTRTWDQEAAERAGEAAGAHLSELRVSLLGVAALHDISAKQQLIEDVRGSSLDALAALGDIDDLDPDVVSGLVTALADGVDQQARAAQGKSVGLGGPNVGRALALINVRYPHAANWGSLFNFLETPAVSGDHKRGALLVLTQLAEQPATG